MSPSSDIFETRRIHVGNVKIGGSDPVRIQSMTTTDTKDVKATVAQALALADAGCEIVRITAPTLADAHALKDIREALRREGCEVPLVADIHFLPAAAMIAADYVDKVRINPGNYADRKMFKIREYTDEDYRAEIDRIHEKVKPLILKLKKFNRALRIGTNHGSLSDRVMNRYGDTPLGMVESAFEYADICRHYDFHNFCFSMKASNVQVMIEAYRLLVEKQKEHQWNYPIHLGVTEAGDGEDARIKSSVGIGTLLSEGIGDTIRVSLTENPVREVEVARNILKLYPRGSRRKNFRERKNTATLHEPQVWWAGTTDLKLLRTQTQKTKRRPDGILLNPKDNKSELKDVLQKDDLLFTDKIPNHEKWFRWNLTSSSPEERLIEASVEVGSTFIDDCPDNLILDGVSFSEALSLAFGILQATRRRMSRPEYIACPSCGRTLFDLEETTARIRNVTSHLNGVKIAIMGCIVNGPGEMADADFGYVGGAPGRVNLYVEKNCVERNIPSKDAPERLIALIKDHGKWVDPPVEESSIAQ